LTSTTLCSKKAVENYFKKGREEKKIRFQRISFKPCRWGKWSSTKCNKNVLSIHTFREVRLFELLHFLLEALLFGLPQKMNFCLLNAFVTSAIILLVAPCAIAVPFLHCCLMSRCCKLYDLLTAHPNCIRIPESFSYQLCCG
jgi:hypothetical protein